MFWIIVAFLVGQTLTLLLTRRTKSTTQAPGETRPPLVAAGTPIPFHFGSVKVEPIIVAFSYGLRPVFSFSSVFGITISKQVVAYERVVTLTALVGWGRILFDDLIFNDSKKLSAEGAQQYLTQFDTSTFPPTVSTGTTSPGGFSYGGFPDNGFHDYSYAEIYLPTLFGGNIPPGEGGISNGDPDAVTQGGIAAFLVICQNRFAPGGKFAFFSGDDSHGGHVPIDDIKNYGTVPATEQCVPVPTTSGHGRILYPHFGYVWEGDVDQGTSSQLNKQEFIVRHLVSINGNLDADAAQVLLAVLTDQEWGLGVSLSLIDGTSFFNAGFALGVEAFGISGSLVQQQAGNDVINEILRTIDGVLYRNPTTGLLSLDLIRGGYVLANQPVLNEANIKELEWTRRDVADTINTVSVVYVDRDRGYTRNIVTVQDHANVFATGSVRQQQFEFPYVSTEAQAVKVAARELKALTLPLGTGTATVDRTVWDAKPGAVLSLSYVRYGLSNVPVRVTSVDSGDLEDGSIVLELIEDLFGLPEVPYTVDPGGWLDPGAVKVAAPTVQAFQSDDGVNGSGRLFIAPSGNVTLVEFATQTGRAAKSAFGSVSMSGGLWAAPDVPLATDAQSYIYWRVTYTSDDGSSQVIQGTLTFQASPTAGGSSTGDPVIVHDGAGFGFVFDQSLRRIITRQ
jgi:hypothetical protein